MNQIRLLLADDHSVVRMGLLAVLELESDLVVVGEAEDGQQAVQKCRELRPDVALLDISMPVMGGLEALRAINAEAPTVRVLMLTNSDLDEDLQQAMQCGAAGYVLKSVSRDELIGAIRRVKATGSYMPEVVRVRLSQLAQERRISGRELQVLDAMRRGLSNRDIAVLLSISEHTVKAHVKTILMKLESADRAEAVARGFEKGLLRLQ